MPLDDSQEISKGGKGMSFDPLPEGVYPFQLITLDAFEDKAYKSEEMVTKFKFEFACLKDEFYGRRVWKDTSNVVSAPGQYQASHLWNLLKDLLGEEPKEDISAAEINALIGTKKNLVLKIHTSGTGNESNRINAFLPLDPEDTADFDEEKYKKLIEERKALEEAGEDAPKE